MAKGLPVASASPKTGAAFRARLFSPRKLLDARREHAEPAVEWRGNGSDHIGEPARRGARRHDARPTDP